MTRAKRQVNHRPTFRYLCIVLLFASGSRVSGQMPGWPPMPQNAFQRLVSGDPAGFVAILQTQAQAGDVLSMLYLGQAYVNVKGVPRNFGEAQRWYRAAAEHGSGPGAWSLGCLYQRGKGLPADPVQAQKWFQKAAELGYRRTALVVSYVRWYPAAEPLTQTMAGPFPASVQLNQEELRLLSNSGMKGRLEIQGGAWGDCGLPARLIVVAQRPIQHEVALPLPVTKTVIYRQDGDTWTKIPADVPTSNKKIRLAPQDPGHPNYTDATVEKEDGSESSGSAFVWR